MEWFITVICVSMQMLKMEMEFIHSKCTIAILGEILRMAHWLIILLL